MIYKSINNRNIKFEKYKLAISCPVGEALYTLAVSPAVK